VTTSELPPPIPLIQLALALFVYVCDIIYICIYIERETYMLAAEGLPNMQVTNTRQGESLEIRSTMVKEPETIQVINTFMAEGPQIKLGIQYTTM
jgi:hypothetical protein